MSDTKYVYKEVAGKDLEKATLAGWEYVSSGIQMSASANGIYVVRRPFQMPTVMELQEQLDETKTALENSKNQLDKVRNVIRNCVADATKTGRSKPSRDELVSIICNLESYMVYIHGL